MRRLLLDGDERLIKNQHYMLCQDILDLEEDIKQKYKQLEQLRKAATLRAFAKSFGVNHQTMHRVFIKHKLKKPQSLFHLVYYRWHNVQSTETKERD